MIAIILVAILGVAIMVGITVIPNLLDGVDKKYYQKRWTEIMKVHASSNDIGAKMAIIEADKLLDHALKAKKIRGETMGERLKSAQNILPNTQSVWEAHKLRNRLVHEEKVFLNSRNSKAALSSFKKALKGLGVL